jgi:L-asparaginase II
VSEGSFQLTTPRSLDSDGVVELAVLERSGLIESRHSGAAVVTDRSGTAVRTLGDATALVYPRSSLKPLQAIAALRAGARLADAELVLATASHAGTPAHIDVVRRMLAAAGLDESALQTPPDWPLDGASHDALAAAGDHRRPVYMNCSGKHAAFLAACVAQGWDTASYLDPKHPLQQLIREVVEEYTSETVTITGIDGCGAPVHAVTLAGMARATSLIARGLDGAGNPDEHASALTAAVLANGWAIDGPGRPNTVVIDELGLFTKGGAEGYIIAAATTGEAVAVKILDGGYRVATLVALRLLAQAGVLDSEDAARVGLEATPKITGGGQVVGTVRIPF